MSGSPASGSADRNSVAGVVRAHLIKREQKLALAYHPGARLVFADGTPDILAYPRDRPGWGKLCRLLTRGNLRAEKGDCILLLDDLLEHIDGLELVVMETSTRDVRGAAPRKMEIDGRCAPCGCSRPDRSRCARRRLRPGEAQARRGLQEACAACAAARGRPRPRAAGGGDALSRQRPRPAGPAHRAGARGRRAADRRQRRVPSSSRPAGLAGRAHLHPRAPDHRQGRPAARRQCRALSQAARGDGAPVPRCAGGDRGDA